MISESRLKEYKKILDTLNKCGWTSVHTLILMTIMLFALVGVPVLFFRTYCCVLSESKTCLIIAFLSCLLIIATVIIMGIKFSMSYIMKKVEDDRNRENKILNMIQEEYEQEHLAEKTRIGIIEKHARAIIEDIARGAESQRQLESKQQDSNAKIADITLEMYKAYCSAQSPQLSDQQIVSQLINLLTNNNK